MKLHQVIFCLLPGLIFLSGCNQGNDDFIYPLSEGSYWLYEGQYLIEDYSQADTSYHESNSFSSMVIVRSEEQQQLETGDLAFKLSSEETSTIIPEDTIRSAYYYMNRDDGLYFVAFDNGGSCDALPKQRSEKPFISGNIRYATVPELISKISTNTIEMASAADTLYYFSYPLRVIPYPLSVGDQWSFQYYYASKKVTGREEYQLGDESFNCYKIEWTYSSLYAPSGYLETTELIGEPGLVQRTIIARNNEYLDDEGNPTGYYFDIEYTYYLTDYLIK